MCTRVSINPIAFVSISAIIMNVIITTVIVIIIICILTVTIQAGVGVPS